MIKNSTTAPTSWVIQDTKRSSSSGGNPADKRLLPNATTAEATDSAIDFFPMVLKLGLLEVGQMILLIHTST
jgi:hypothetical protein